jgi:alkylation response protein AidB-like acyl-CoA dehydrogenase
MLNFSLTDEQEEIRRLAHSLALDHLRPQARSAEREGDISPTLLQTLDQTGLTTPFSEAYGGSGDIEAMVYMLVAEELGFGDGGLALNVLSSLMGPVAVSLAGSEQQRASHILPFGNGKDRGCFAFAERTGGYSLSNINTIVRKVGENYLLNGIKRDVIHGSQARLRVLLARMEGTEGSDGICAFVLPPDLEGLEITPEHYKLGLIAAPGASYHLNDVSLPPESLLGEGEGVVRAATLYMLLRAGVACGTARAALEYAGKYAEERIAFGRPIVSYQGIAFILAEMAMKLDAARLLLWSAAQAWDQDADLPTLVRDASAAQLQALKIARSATIDAVQVMGGAGFMQDHPAEMWMRNAAAME